MTKRPARNQLRIIGGKWRGRKIQFPNVEGLRPTSDRVRETLFNWLSDWIAGAYCLDLFAGSGALGFEASSRGAASVTLVDQHREVITALTNAKKMLAAANITIVQAQAAQFIDQAPALAVFDLIFLDPPFGYLNLDALLKAIDNGNLLKPSGWIYLESVANRTITVPTGWRLHRQKQAGQVDYRLFQRLSSSLLQSKA